MSKEDGDNIVLLHWFLTFYKTTLSYSLALKLLIPFVIGCFKTFKLIINLQKGLLNLSSLGMYNVYQFIVHIFKKIIPQHIIVLQIMAGRGGGGVILSTYIWL